MVLQTLQTASLARHAELEGWKPRAGCGFGNGAASRIIGKTL
jgi:hypothetical protein